MQNAWVGLPMQPTPWFVQEHGRQGLCMFRGLRGDLSVHPSFHRRLKSGSPLAILCLARCPKMETPETARYVHFLRPDAPARSESHWPQVPDTAVVPGAGDTVEQATTCGDAQRGLQSGSSVLVSAFRVATGV